MSVEKVKNYLKTFGMEDRVMEFEVSSATVELAARAVGVEPARIAKSMSFRGREGAILVVTAGDAKVDNRKFKDFFHIKASMLSAEEAKENTGYAVGGVCPFDNPAGLAVYLDVSLKRFETVFPAAGSANSAVRVSCDELMQTSKALQWVDVCKGWLKAD